MTNYSRFLSAALLSASLAVAGASAAQAGSIADQQPDDGQMGSPLTAHRVIRAANNVSGMDIIYSSEVLPVGNIGPRDASERATQAADYGLKAPLNASPQVAESAK